MKRKNRNNKVKIPGHGCVFCGINRLKPIKSDFSEKVGNYKVTVKNTPALLCEKCGRVYFGIETTRKIKKNIIKKYKDTNIEGMIFDYEDCR